MTRAKGRFVPIGLVNCTRCELPKPPEDYGVSSEGKQRLICLVCEGDAGIRREILALRSRYRKDAWVLLSERSKHRLASLALRHGTVTARGKFGLGDDETIKVLHFMTVERENLDVDDDLWNRYVIDGKIQVERLVSDARVTRDRGVHLAVAKNRQSVLTTLKNIEKNERARVARLEDMGVSHRKALAIIARDRAVLPFWTSVSEKGTEVWVRYDIEAMRVVTSIDIGERDFADLPVTLRDALRNGRLRVRLVHVDACEEVQDHVAIYRPGCNGRGDQVMATIPVKCKEARVLDGHTSPASDVSTLDRILAAGHESQRRIQQIMDTKAANAA